MNTGQARRLEGVAVYLQRLVEDGSVPGGILSHGTSRDVHHQAFGVKDPVSHPTSPTPDTIYDAASLTKILATWPLLGALTRTSGLNLDAPLHTALSFLDPQLPGASISPRNILTHRSGLQPETRLDRYQPNDLADLRTLATRICAEPLHTTPGTQRRYINRGFVLLGITIATTLGRPLEQAAADLWRDAGLHHTTYQPTAPRSHYAPASADQLDKNTPQAHDPNAALLGGIAGHAGAFTTPADLTRYAQTLLAAHRHRTPLGQWLGESLTPHCSAEGTQQQGLAWQLTQDGDVAFHHGYTGTSLYIAPTRDRFLTICTNATYHPHPDPRALITPLRALARAAL